MLAPKKCICGQTIVFVQDADNPATVHPLSVSSPCFEVFGEGDKRLAHKRHRDFGLAGEGLGGDNPVLVSHFATCTKINEFRAQRKQIEAS